MRLKDKIQNNPWAGLSSYEDPAKSSRKLKFCGRDSDTFDVTRLIDDNFFVTLYGKSGIGKTSLLNAGVFPALRREQYTPLSLRLGMTEDTQSFQDIITYAVERAVEEMGGSVRVIPVVEAQADSTAIDFLWNWFARRQFLTAEGQTTFPVVVFDQFEEVFRQSDSRAKTEVLLAQLHYLIDESHAIGDCIVEGEEYSYDFNFRFVLSIREDDLYRLEDSIDNCALTALKRCRYRLRSLSEQGARAAILIPGEGLFRPEEQDGIVQTIVGIARNKEEQNISTNLLSLVCNRIFVEFQKKKDAGFISQSLVDTFVKGNPFERFYDEATKGFSNKEKSYIEEHLVDSTGRRNSMPESDFLLHVHNGAKLLEGNTRILQRSSVSTDGGNYRIELIHDSFCEPLSRQREKREKRRRKFRRIKWFTVVFGIVILSFIIIGFGIHQMNEITKANWTMKENQARFTAEKAVQLADEGDSYLAMMLALEILPANLDNPEKPYTPEAEAALRYVIKQKGAVIKSYSGWIDKVAFSSDGKKILSVDSRIKVWDFVTGKCLINLSPAYSYHSPDIAVFSPDNKNILISVDSIILVYNIESNQYVDTLWGHSSYITDIAYHPNGHLIVSSSGDKTLIWDVPNGRCLHVLKGHTNDVYSACFSPDGKYVLTASVDKTLKKWNVSNGKCIQTMNNPVGFACAQISPDGKWIVSGSWDNAVRLWDFNTGRCIRTMKRHRESNQSQEGIYSVAFSPDGKILAAASSDNTICLWSVSSGECIKELRMHSNNVTSVVFSPDGKYLVSGSYDETLRIWEVFEESEGTVLEGLPPRLYIPCANSAVFSPDGKQIAVSYNDEIIRIWDAQTSQCLDILKGHGQSVNSVAYSHDGKYIVSASRDNTIRKWDSKSRRCKDVLYHENDVCFVTFSNNGETFVSASWDGRAVVWDVEDCVPRHVFRHPDMVECAVFSPDDKFIATGSHDGVVRVWNIETGECTHSLTEHTGLVSGVAYSPSGKHLASASRDGSIRVWDIESDSCVLTKVFGPEGCQSVVYSQDGKYLLITYGETVKVLDAVTGICIQTYNGHSGIVNQATFSPDGRRIVSASYDNNAIIWDFPPLQELIDETRKRFKDRQLTPEERKKYYLE